jgi:hypothetical protein
VPVLQRIWTLIDYGARCKDMRVGGETGGRSHGLSGGWSDAAAAAPEGEYATGVVRGGAGIEATPDACSGCSLHAPTLHAGRAKALPRQLKGCYSEIREGSSKRDVIALASRAHSEEMMSKKGARVKGMGWARRCKALCWAMGPTLATSVDKRSNGGR